MPRVTSEASTERVMTPGQATSRAGGIVSTIGRASGALFWARAKSGKRATRIGMARWLMGFNESWRSDSVDVQALWHNLRRTLGQARVFCKPIFRKEKLRSQNQSGAVAAADYGKHHIEKHPDG